MLLESKMWKERLAGIEKELELAGVWINEGKIDEMCDAIVRQLSVVPGWKESNFQVNKGVFSLITKCASACGSFSKGAAAIAVGGRLSKLLIWLRVFVKWLY